jgi:hypothetical protein
VCSRVVYHMWWFFVLTPLLACMPTCLWLPQSVQTRPDLPAVDGV